MPSPERRRDGLLLRRGLFGREFVSYDEFEALEGEAARLRDGGRRTLRPEQRATAAQALTPPAPGAGLSADAEALLTWMEGDWAPQRGVAALLRLADEGGATDLHLEAAPTGFELRARLAGELRGIGRLSTPTGQRLIAALKHAAGCLPYRSDTVQEGRIPRAGVAADVRASFLPTAMGERVALRLFGRLRSLDALGLSPEARSALDALLACERGLVLIAGASGAGKTTTVYAALKHLCQSRGGAHLSIEDPVEQRLRLAGVPVDQIELCPERGLTAEVALQGALRQDVDVVALSEVRSPGEARLALEAAHTGRLVLAGLHAGSTAEASQRMIDLGADPQVLRSSLRGVLHQRLLTEDCSPEADCPDCRGLGRRRRALAEAWIAGGLR